MGDRSKPGMTFLLLFLVSALFFINPASGGLGSNAVPYRPDLASIGLDLSNAAYCERDEIVKWSCPPCKRLQAAGIVPSSTPIVIDGVVGGFGVVKKWGTRAVIAVFPGLVPYHDACPTCRVHEGFYQSWFSLARPVLQAVSDMHAESPKAEILVTGHSVAGNCVLCVPKPVVCALLCCAVLCCAVLCCAVLCCVVLCCAGLCCAVFCSVLLYCAVLCCAVLCCAVLCSVVLCCAVLGWAVLCCAVLCCAVLCSVLLCCVVLCCVVLCSA